MRYIAIAEGKLRATEAIDVAEDETDNKRERKGRNRKGSHIQPIIVKIE